MTLLAVLIYCTPPLELESTWELMGGIKFTLAADSLSSFVLLWVAIFGVLVTMFSITYMDGHEGEHLYYPEILICLAASAGAVLARNWIVFIFFWDIVLLGLYGLILLGKKTNAEASRKTLILVGLSDFALLLGVILLWNVTDSLNVIPVLPVALKGRKTILAFLLMALGALTKAGSYPFHTWLPAMAKDTPSPAVALLPASLDKLLGIYLLTRLVLNVFVITPGSAMSLLLMAIGAATVLGAVLMALIQHDLKKLMAFHAISQVGYMVLGIGTALPIGIAGGLLHMLNNAIYKSCLFLCGGVVEKRTGTTEIAKLGGLAACMPLTFGACIIASLSISGIPPLNGFYSKWLVYQGVIEVSRNGHAVIWIFLLAALFGSAFTLASFMKVIFSAFLGKRPEKLAAPRPAGFFMGFPLIILALLCVVFGLFAQEIPISKYILPSINTESISIIGRWEADQATVLLIFGMILGLLVYLIGNISKLKVSPTYIGGEQLTDDQLRIDGTQFYGPVRRQPGLARGYEEAESGAFDFYVQGTIVLNKMTKTVHRSVDGLIDRLTEAVGELTMETGNLLGKAHTGSLPAYISWSLVGLLLILIYLFIG